MSLLTCRRVVQSIATRSALINRAICAGSRSKLNGPNTMLGGKGGITVASVNSRPLPSFGHSSNRGHGASLLQELQFAAELSPLNICVFVPLPRKFFLLAPRYVVLTLLSLRCDSPGFNENLPVLFYSQYTDAIAQSTRSAFVSRLALSPQLIPVLRPCLNLRPR